MRALKDWLCVCVLSTPISAIHSFYLRTHFILDSACISPPSVMLCFILFLSLTETLQEIKALALSVYYKNDYLKLAHSAVYLHKDSCVMTWQNRLVIQPSERVIDWPALTPNQTLTCWICSNLPGLKEVLGCV